MMWPFTKRKKSPIELMREREDREFIEAMRCMAFELRQGCLTNHGLSEYGAAKLLASGKEPGPLDHRVLLDDGTFITYEEWKERQK